MFSIASDLVFVVDEIEKKRGEIPFTKTFPSLRVRCHNSASVTELLNIAPQFEKRDTNNTNLFSGTPFAHHILISASKAIIPLLLQIILSIAATTVQMPIFEKSCENSVLAF